jgi:hypothetical protein
MYRSSTRRSRRYRKLLPPPPPRREEVGIEEPAPSLTDAGGGVDVGRDQQAPLPASRRRVPWARLLRRVLHISQVR